MGELSEERQRALAWLQGIAESDPAGEVDIVPARVLVIWLEEADSLRSKLAEAERNEIKNLALAKVAVDENDRLLTKLAEVEVERDKVVARGAGAVARAGFDPTSCSAEFAIDTLRGALALSEKHVGRAKDRVAALEGERDAWRDVIAVLCGDGGHYHQEHGTEATKQHALDRFYALRKRVEALEGAVSDPEMMQHAHDEITRAISRNPSGCDGATVTLKIGHVRAVLRALSEYEEVRAALEGEQTSNQEEPCDQK